MGTLVTYEEFARRRQQRLGGGAPPPSPASPGLPDLPPVQRVGPAAGPPPAPPWRGRQQSGLAIARQLAGQSPEMVLRTVILQHILTTEGDRWLGVVQGTSIVEVGNDAAQTLILLNGAVQERGQAPLYLDEGT